MPELSRRSFLAGFAAATAAVTLPRKKARAQAPVNPGDPIASLIDVSACDGCPDRDTPRCVAACRTANAHRFPEPDPSEIKDYWPQPKHEDWSQKRGVTDRLTPYNWTFVQKLSVQHEGRTVQVNVPRRCMHCDNPPCVKLCPFGVAKKDPEGPTYIDPSLCFGGAKCRTVCPWNVPQRQAGVGVYTYLDPLPVGGGVMFKCDLCRDKLAEGKTPACATACPNGAIRIGDRATLAAEAERLAREYGGERWQEHLYGRDENGGTSTFYVSRVPFAAIDEAIVAQTEKKRAKLAETNPEAAKNLTAMRMAPVDNLLERHTGLAAAALAAPLVGAAAAFAMTVAKRERSGRGKANTTAAGGGDTTDGGNDGARA